MLLFSALYFMLGVAVMAAFAAASYFGGQWFRRVAPRWATLIDYVLCVLGLPILAVNLIVVLPLCIWGAYASSVNENQRHSRFYYFVGLLSSTALPALLLMIGVLQVVYGHFAPPPSVMAFVNAKIAPSTQDELMWLVWGASLGLAATPSVIPISLWLWHSSRLRPGVDRALLPEEHLPHEVG